MSDALQHGELMSVRRAHYGYLFIAPVFVFLCAVIVFPLGHAFWTSLQRVRGLSRTFVGLDNYRHIFDDDAFWHSLDVSLRFTAVCVTLHVLLGLALALLLNELRFARKTAAHPVPDAVDGGAGRRRDDLAVAAGAAVRRRQLPVAGGRADQRAASRGWASRRSPSPRSSRSTSGAACRS